MSSLAADAHFADAGLAGSLSADYAAAEFAAHGGSGVFARLLSGAAAAKDGGYLEPPAASAAGEDAADRLDEAILAWQVFGYFNHSGDPVPRLDAGGDELPGGEGALPQEAPAQKAAQQAFGADGLRGSQGAHYAGADAAGISVPQELAADLAGYAARALRDGDLEASRAEKGLPAARARRDAGSYADRAAAQDAHSGADQGEEDLSPVLPKADMAAARGEGDRSAFSQIREKRGRANIEVRDLRTGSAQDAARAGETIADVSRSIGYDALRPASHEIELPVNLKLSALSGDALEGRKTGHEFSQSRFLEDALARELRGNLSGDIVKNASLIIRNGGEGTIRLALNPASLGQVKIHLEMTENKIMGHIIVESNEALRAFQKELAVLERAFRDSGFIETSLDMSLAQDSRDFGAGRDRQEETMPAFDLGAASRYEAGSGLAEDSFVSDGAILSDSPERKSINLFI